jgi:hypothetical protein
MTTTDTGLGQISGNVLFYSNPEPLTPQLHSGLGVKQMDGPFGFARKGHVVPVAVTEFSLAAITGPIIFVGEEKTPLLVMGLRQEENMWVQPNGQFEAGVYVPAYIRRYPFVFANDDQAGQMVLCIDRGAEFIAEGGEMAFFDAEGQPTEYTKSCMEFCNNYEQERQRTAAFVQLLKDFDLFELKTAYFTPVNADGSAAPQQKIADYFGVSEQKLAQISAEKLADLRNNGALAQIYAHLLSLVGWDKLIALMLVRDQAAADAANG